MNRVSRRHYVAMAALLLIVFFGAAMASCSPHPDQATYQTTPPVVWTDPVTGCDYIRPMPLVWSQSKPNPIQPRIAADGKSFYCAAQKRVSSLASI